MCKKINQDAVAIKQFISNRAKQADIARSLVLTGQKLIIAQKMIIQNEKRRKKLSKFYNSSMS